MDGAVAVQGGAKAEVAAAGLNPEMQGATAAASVLMGLSKS